MTWETSGGELLFAEIDSDTLALILQTNEDSFTALVTRAEAESLAAFLAEWCGFPLYFYSNDGEFHDD